MKKYEISNSADFFARKEIINITNIFICFGGLAHHKVVKNMYLVNKEREKSFDSWVCNSFVCTAFVQDSISIYRIVSIMTKISIFA